MASYVLAFDVGTSQIKFALVGPKGEILSAKSIAGGAGEPSKGELDPALVWRSLVEIVRGLSEADRRRVTMVALTCQLATCFLDKDGESVRNAITWQDRRAVAQALEMRERHPDLERMARRPLAAERSASILLWLRENEPDAFARTATVFHLKDYLNFRLTGQITTDLVHAAYTGLFDVRERQFSGPLLCQFGFSHVNWGRLVNPCSIVGTLSKTAADQLCLTRDVRVVGGAPDGTMASIAAGAASSNQASDVGGTSEVVFACAEEFPATIADGLVVNPHPDGQRWLVGGPMFSTGLALQWVSKVLGCPIDQLGKLAASSAPGANGVLFIPTLSGSRAPDWNPSARGAFLGLSLEHSASDLARAAYEGIAFSIRHILELCREAGCRIDSVFLAGGASRDPFFCQIKANCLGIPAESAPMDEPGILGAVACAWTADGKHRTLSEAITQLRSTNRRQYASDWEASSFYRECFARWMRYSKLSAMEMDRGQGSGSCSRYLQL